MGWRKVINIYCQSIFSWDNMICVTQQTFRQVETYIQFKLVSCGQSLKLCHGHQVMCLQLAATQGSSTDWRGKLGSREWCTWDLNSPKPTLELFWLENETWISFLKWIPGQRWLSTDKRFENEKLHISQCYYHRSEIQLGSERLTLTSSVSQHPLQHKSNHLNTMNIH